MHHSETTDCRHCDSCGHRSSLRARCLTSAVQAQAKRACGYRATSVQLSDRRGPQRRGVRHRDRHAGPPCSAAAASALGRATPWVHRGEVAGCLLMPPTKTVSQYLHARRLRPSGPPAGGSGPTGDQRRLNGGTLPPEEKFRRVLNQASARPRADPRRPKTCGYRSGCGPQSGRVDIELCSHGH